MASSQTDPPEDIPAELVAALRNSADRKLREITNYAQPRLREHLPISGAVESRHGEKLVRVEDHGAVTIATVVRPDAPGGARGPSADRVIWGPNIEEAGGRYEWHCRGNVHDDPGAGRND